MENGLLGGLQQSRRELQAPAREIGERRFSDELHEPFGDDGTRGATLVASSATVQGWLGCWWSMVRTLPTIGSRAAACLRTGHEEDDVTGEPRSSFIGALAAELRLRRVIRELESLDDHRLRDLGLTRGSIERAVRWDETSERQVGPGDTPGELPIGYGRSMGLVNSLRSQPVVAAP
jgi:uncharacterized protein YjiS (DUF1127 family)